MVFSSTTFLFIFLPCVYLLSVLIRNIHARNWLLIIASLLLYAWGEPVYVLLMIASSLINYVFASLIDKRSTEASRRTFMILSVIFNIGMLCVFKYTNFIVDSVNAALSTAILRVNIPLPIGISFYTFQALSYVLDVYFKKHSANRRFSAILLYISFFPQLIAGPIVKYHDIERQIEHRTMTIEGGANGMRRFIIGLAMKLIIANTMAGIADTLYSADAAALNAPAAWMMAIAYLFQIYFDFAGYSQMAIGLGEMFGFKIPQNFNYPYISCGMTDFWRRWHISLSSWFKEYVYIPLGGNRKGAFRTAINKLTVFLLTGLWHGASWNFAVWGLYNGAFLMAEGAILPKGKQNKRFSPLLWLYTILAVTIGFVIFRAETLSYAFSVISAMFTGFSVSGDSAAQLSALLSPYVVTIFITACIASTPIMKYVSTKLERAPRIKLALSYTAALILLCVCVMLLAADSYNPFIYFRF